MNRAIVFASALMGCGGAFAPTEDAGESDASTDVAQVLDDAAIEAAASDASAESATDASDASALDAPSSIVCVIDGIAYACEAVDWVWYSTPIETSPCNVGVCPVGRGCYFPKPGGAPSGDIGSCEIQ